MNDVALKPQHDPHPFDASPSSQWSTERKLHFLAEKIGARMKSCGLTKKEFAKAMDVQPSIVTRWLSGKHNFTVETIFDIEQKLNFLIFDVSKSTRTWGIQLHLVVHSSTITRMPNSGELINALISQPFSSYPKAVPEGDDDMFLQEFGYQLPEQVCEAIKDWSKSK